MHGTKSSLKGGEQATAMLYLPPTSGEFVNF
jgi:hypothetical protein